MSVILERAEVENDVLELMIFADSVFNKVKADMEKARQL